MIDSELEDLQVRREKLEQEYKSLKRKQRGLQNAFNILSEKLSIKELEDKQRELPEISLPNIPIQEYTADLAEKCRKALEVSFGEIPMPFHCLKKNKA
jgi:predicted transcriptional regulator